MQGVLWTILLLLLAGLANGKHAFGRKQGVRVKLSDDANAGGCPATLWKCCARQREGGVPAGNAAALRGHPYLDWLTEQRDEYVAQRTKGWAAAASEADVKRVFVGATPTGDGGQAFAEWLERRGGKQPPPGMREWNFEFQDRKAAKPYLAMARMPFETQFAQQLVDGLPAYDARLFSGRGVVFTGGAHHVQLVSRTAALLCGFDEQPLPIELWHNNEIDPAVCKDLWRFNGVACRDISAVVPFVDKQGHGADNGKRKPLFQNKAVALALSSFEQVLMIDADSVPQRGVTHLFESEQLARTGQLFWPDIWGSISSGFSSTAKTAAVWPFAGVRPYMTQEQESGQLLIDKKRVWRELNLALHLNLRDYLTRNAEHGNIVYGDKDIFRLSWLFLRTPFMMAAQPVWLGRDKRKGFCLRSQGQIDTNPAKNEAMFVHQPKRMRMPVSTLALYDFVCDTTGDPAYTRDLCRPKDGSEDDVSRCVQTYPPTQAFPPSIGWMLHECKDGADGGVATCTTTPWVAGFKSDLYDADPSAAAQKAPPAALESHDQKARAQPTLAQSKQENESAQPKRMAAAAAAVASSGTDAEDLPPMPAATEPHGMVACLPAKRITDFGALLAELRALGCKLPAIIYHYKGEYTDADRKRAAALDDNTRVVELVEDARFAAAALGYRGITAARTKGFACKPLALMQAPFKKVMIVDYDLVFLARPEVLFASSGFERTGTMFFYDRPTQAEGKKAKGLHNFMRREGMELFEAIRTEPWYTGLAAVGNPVYPSGKLKASDVWTRDVFGADSGVTLVDKERQPRMMELLRRFYLKMMKRTYGDKETFWLAAELARSEYAFSGFAAGYYGRGADALRTAPTYMCCGEFAHYHPDTGDVLFFHGDMVKDRFKGSEPSVVTVADTVRGEFVVSAAQVCCRGAGCLEAKLSNSLRLPLPPSLSCFPLSFFTASACWPPKSFPCVHRSEGARLDVARISCGRQAENASGWSFLQMTRWTALVVGSTV